MEDVFGMYLDSLPDHVVLASAEERQLASAAKQARLCRDPAEHRQSPLSEAEDRLIQSHLRLVVHEAKRFYALNKAWIDLEDLVAAGNEGLIDAIARFDEERGFRFWTFAKWWVLRSMSKEVRHRRWLIPIPESDFKSVLKVQRAYSYLSYSLRRPPTEAEIAAHLDWTCVGLKSFRYRCEFLNAVASLDKPVRGGLTPLGDLISDDRYRDGGEFADDEVSHLARKSIVAEIVRGHLAELDSLERRVLELRFGIDGERPLTFKEVGLMLQYSPEGVRRIEIRALVRLRKCKNLQQLVA